MKSGRVLLPVVAVVLIVAALVYFYFDPSSSRWFPRCMFLESTGFKCPGCGSQRAIHALLHGHVATAWHFNAMMVVSMPVIAFYLAVSAGKNRWPRFYDTMFSRPVLLSLVILVVLWWVVRNVAGW